MAEFPPHPGLGLIKKPSIVERIRAKILENRENTIHSFVRYINPEGLSHNQQAELETTIKELYAVTQQSTDLSIRTNAGGMWKPTYCKKTLHAIPFLRKLTPYPVFITEDKEKSHRWIEMDHPDAGIIIIDPSGLLPTYDLQNQLSKKLGFAENEELEQFVARYQPYFGKKDTVENEFPKKIYYSGVRLTSQEEAKLTQDENYVSQ